MPDRRAFMAWCLRLGAAWPTFAVPSWAVDYPTRPIQLIVPYAAGGGTDTVARLVAAGMAARLGQPVVVVNRPGAGTIIGTQAVARAAPDGYTIGLVSVGHAANYTLYKEMPYAQSDFVPIAMLTDTPNVFVVNPRLPVTSLADMIAYIKARPGVVNYASFGVGTSPHLAALQFAALIGAQLVHVPYRGGAPAALAVMTGEVQMTFASAISVRGGMESGMLRALAVASRERLKIFPDLPTFIESGVPFTNGAWFGLLAPAGTPEPIVSRLYGVTRDVLAQKQVIETFTSEGVTPYLMDPETFGRFIADETTKWKRVLTSIAVEPL
jgi:tripartite-type tricarboxylate transporter receptor subunit TctC